MPVCKLIPITRSEYSERMEIVPPALELMDDFLMGEPSGMSVCQITGNQRLTYGAYFEFRGRCYAAERSLTKDEFLAMRRDIALHTPETMLKASETA